jgi:hypothetical protein
MSQTTHTKHAREQTAQAAQADRAEQQAEDALNDAVLQADQHTGQQGVFAPSSDALNAADVKDAYDMLHQRGWHRDEISRLRLVPPGTLLPQGGVYLDLRNLVAGELTATGEETIGVELLVPKRDTDYEMWNKLKETR